MTKKIDKFFKKNILIIDTSTDMQIVILTCEQNILDININIKAKSFVSCMIPLINNILKTNSIDLFNIQKIIVGCGPGSYTGTKVGVLTSKLLALELKIPLFKISSLLLLSSGFDQNFLTPKIKINKDYFYALSFQNNKIILKESRYSSDFLVNYQNHILLSSLNYKISLCKIFNYLNIVNNFHKLSPNYYCFSWDTKEI
ncbi:MAG: tRNA (adenosine(37)-N6)-threonylcarbamoyltransferase complex dimerization subunit type 1 TsaB [Pigeon pea little leaf phytoplasma]|uniref:tRNA (Adenosine(37)-N6)-threonylcarbamoyltransferase complex dimerization subunit type 1 TsaB n=1 Tax=Candidatus Phytoplasma fabacearum TaxID=2982628 RepID=A0ABU8ZSR1_9MOLU|nr:tRNA (adenosine(37)-N6)-threonylcarbamoyltransferase complex dimerization subunit type 1 TsaB ['Bituminaria bituminosa' little leaf phytoplasma]MDV3148963.1 tRNA (adenosine(37)-N6)-threonylcarbamoyltransferase complex dimerization subunit type 1 TsaB [Pigeon pea little leaf phytoplasma]MDO7983700.1 tRNA (adenosine(37)-N6)-threonylcarbamoyltransferase complex dimerization subunit type 1 TsaB ['Bituminaria bituminosa' little leaf phytoplasma]MDO8023972.1 tRNA (adenosine(37)-N6)-threonylcarbamoy